MTYRKMLNSKILEIKGYVCYFKYGKRYFNYNMVTSEFKEMNFYEKQ